MPILQARVSAEKVSVWNDQTGLSRPLRALWLTNSSGVTLDGGSFAVMEAETFAGEGIFEPIRPGEKRLISYATDLAVNASSRHATESQRVTRVRIARGTMTHESEIREKKTYTFRNEDASPRSIIVEHAIRPGFTLRSDVRPVESTAGWMRFRVDVGAKQTASLEIEEARPTEATFMLTNLNADQIGLFARQRTIDNATEEALRRILAQKAAISDIDSRKSSRQAEMERIFDDQQRLRENMKALRGSAEEKALLQRYTQQLSQQETRLEALQKEIGGLEAKQTVEQEKLDRMIAELAVDTKV